MTHTDVIRKLIGHINPVGETNSDNEAFQNIKKQCEVINDLLEDVQRIASLHRNRQEYSMKRVGTLAQEFIDLIKQRD